MVNAQEYINEKYPNKEEIKILEINNQDLEGDLDLSKFSNLEELNCSHNLIDNLTLGQCSKLVKINCSYNTLDTLKFLHELPDSSKQPVEINLEECGVENQEITSVLQKLNLTTKLENNKSEDNNLISTQSQKLLIEFANLKQQNKSLKEQIIFLQSNKEINWSHVKDIENHLQEINFQEKQHYLEKSELENQLASLDQQYKDKEIELKKLNDNDQQNQEKLEKQLAKIREEKDLLEKQLQDKEEQITNLKSKYDDEMDLLKNSINKLKQQLKKINIQKIELEKKLEKGLSKNLEIRKEERDKFVEKCINSSFLNKEKKIKKIKRLLNKKKNVIELSKKLTNSEDVNLLKLSEEELDELKLSVDKLIGKDKCNKLCSLQEEIINLEIEQKELEQTITEFSKKQSNPWTLTIIEKEEEFENLLEWIGNKLDKNKDKEAKKLLHYWASKENFEEKLDDILKGRGIDETKRKKTDKLKKQISELKQQSLLWEAKSFFLNTRQITIKRLQNCYNKLKGNKKYALTEEVGNLIIAGSGVAESLTLGIPKALGETIKAINASFKRKFSDNIEQEFTELLINDKENLIKLESEIVNISKIENIKLFNNRYHVFDLDSSLWEDKPISTLEEMEKVIALLNDNLIELINQLENEGEQLKRKREQSKEEAQIEISNSSY